MLVCVTNNKIKKILMLLIVFATIITTLKISHVLISKNHRGWSKNPKNGSSIKVNKDEISFQKSLSGKFVPFKQLPICNHHLLLVLVLSSPENFLRRDAIRKYWRRDINGLSRIAFLIGKSDNRFLNVLLNNEFEQFQDTLLGDFRDTYKNLTIKVLHGMRWSVENCQFTYLLKTDDDCYVNLRILVNFLRKQKQISGLYVGRIRRNAPVIRNTNSRWYVSPEDFVPNIYPPYASGAGYVLSEDVVCSVVRASGTIYPFPNEDAYIGEVLYRQDIKPTNSARFSSGGGGLYHLCNFEYLFVVHGVDPTAQRKFRMQSDNASRFCAHDEIDDWS